MQARYALTFMFLGPLMAAAQYPPVAGTNRDSAAYFDAAENYLLTLDLNDPSLEFERLGGTTATNWSVRVNGTPVADLKCTSGNTNHRGAVVTYRLGRALGFDIYPVAVYRDVNRQIGGRNVTGQCALKAWASVFTQYYWTRDTFADTDDQSKSALIDALDCRNAQPAADEPYLFFARSAYGHPSVPGSSRVRYSGRSSLLQATRDFSTMMAIDVLIGNEDRFPGGNAFFRSVTTQYEADGDSIEFADARLFSLDNEAAFKGASPAPTYAARDLRDHVFRFDADFIGALQRLEADDNRLAEVTDGDAAIARFIGEGIRIVTEQYGAAQARCGAEDARFTAG